MISKACKYAIRAAICVAKAELGIRLNVKEIAREIEAPEAFTAKVLQTLNKHRVITSMKGPYGGFYLEENQKAQPVINIVNAIDGLSVFSECGLGLKECSEDHPCPMHEHYAAIRKALLMSFQGTTLGDLATEVNDGRHFINNVKSAAAI